MNLLDQIASVISARETDEASTRKLTDMPEFTRPYLDDLCDNIDAAVFTGDAFMEAANRTSLEWYMARWKRGLENAAETELESGED